MHIIQRGINREACFFSETDFRVYLSLLRELAPRYDCAVHAYVLMTNHVHLLVTPAKADSASLVMKHLGQQFVQYVNRSKDRTGSLWEGRFRSSIVDSDRYLLRCHQYVEMNPVRAGMVSRPGDYPWSSHRTNACGAPSDLISMHPQLERMGATADERCSAYLRLFEAGLTTEELEDIRNAANGGFPLGSRQFIEELEVVAGRSMRRRRRRRKR
jgi:putative transposase